MEILKNYGYTFNEELKGWTKTIKDVIYLGYTGDIFVRVYNEDMDIVLYKNNQNGAALCVFYGISKYIINEKAINFINELEKQPRFSQPISTQFLQKTRFKSLEKDVWQLDITNETQHILTVYNYCLNVDLLHKAMWVTIQGKQKIDEPLTIFETISKEQFTEGGLNNIYKHLTGNNIPIIVDNRTEKEKLLDRINHLSEHECNQLLEKIRLAAEIKEIKQQDSKNQNEQGKW